MISNEVNLAVVGIYWFAPNCLKTRSVQSSPKVRKRVLRIGSRIGTVAGAKTSMELSTVIDLDLGEMKSTILLSPVVGKCSDRTQ